MARRVRLEAVSKQFRTLGRTFVAVDDLSLDIPPGSFTTLVGPSGCGKTTTLRMIAGLETPTSGRIYFDDEDVTDRPPQRRDLAMVFQSIALYPHMTVRENIAYGLKVKGVPRAERHDRVDEAAAVLQIEDHLEKQPAELSGGQQQRVALGGAFVQDPEVLLLDEPMSDLDAKLKADLRVEIQRLHQELDATVVYVTHDQTEAMTMSDRVVLLRDGRLEQSATPTTLFDEPVSAYAASFIGTPSTNLLDCVVEAGPGGFEVVGHGFRVPFEGDWLAPHEDRPITLGVRPQYLDPAGGEVRLDVSVEVTEPLGTEAVIHGHSPAGTRVDVVASPAALEGVGPGDTLGVWFDPEDCFLFDAEGRTIAFGRRPVSEASP